MKEPRIKLISFSRW